MNFIWNKTLAFSVCLIVLTSTSAPLVAKDPYIADQLAQIDYASKTGAGTVRLGLEKFIIQFCQGANQVA